MLTNSGIQSGAGSIANSDHVLTQLRIHAVAPSLLLVNVMMIDVALSILALIAGGLTLELFAVSSPTDKQTELTPETAGSLDEALIGNPS